MFSDIYIIYRFYDISRQKIIYIIFTLSTKKPLGDPNGLKMVLGVTLVASMGIEYKVAPHLLTNSNYTALAYPFLLNIMLYFDYIRYHFYVN